MYVPERHRTVEDYDLCVHPELPNAEGHPSVTVNMCNNCNRSHVQGDLCPFLATAPTAVPVRGDGTAKNGAQKVININIHGMHPPGTTGGTQLMPVQPQYPQFPKGNIAPRSRTPFARRKRRVHHKPDVCCHQPQQRSVSNPANEVFAPPTDTQIRKMLKDAGYHVVPPKGNQIPQKFRPVDSALREEMERHETAARLEERILSKKSLRGSVAGSTSTAPPLTNTNKGLCCPSQCCEPESTPDTPLPDIRLVYPSEVPRIALNNLPTDSTADGTYNSCASAHWWANCSCGS
eukprot:Lankesteria_metandrocarpae@DN8493_c0_g1_i1.p1